MFLTISISSTMYNIEAMGCEVDCSDARRWSSAGKHGKILWESPGVKVFHGGETVQLSRPPVPSRPPFISWAHVSIAGSQIINDRDNVLNIISSFFSILL